MVWMRKERLDEIGGLWRLSSCAEARLDDAMVERIHHSNVMNLKMASRRKRYGQRNLIVVAGDPDPHHHPACVILALKQPISTLDIESPASAGLLL